MVGLYASGSRFAVFIAIKEGEFQYQILIGKYRHLPYSIALTKK